MEIAVVAFALAALNVLLARNNLGWLNLQPTPYILLPVLAGARHGPGAGVVAGLAAFALGGLGHFFENGSGSQTLLADHWGFLFWSLALGALCGEIQFQGQQESAAAIARRETAEVQLQHLEKEMLVLRQAKEELNRLIALRDLEQGTMDTGLRWLSASNPHQLAHNTLLLLNRQTRVTDAALYYLDRATGMLHREALLGREDNLPPQLDPHTTHIARIALERGQAVTVPELLQLALGEPQDYLTAVPFLTCQGEAFGLLLVTGLPFMAFTPKTLNYIELICKWAAGFIELKDSSLGRYRLIEGAGDNRKIYCTDFFHHVVGISAEAFQRQRTLSTLVLFCVPDAPKAFQMELESRLMRHLRSGDYAAQLEIDVPHVVVLLPLTGEHGSCIFVERTISNWRHETYVIEAYSTPLEQKNDLQILLRKATKAQHGHDTSSRADLR